MTVDPTFQISFWEKVFVKAQKNKEMKIVARRDNKWVRPQKHREEWASSKLSKSSTKIHMGSKKMNLKKKRSKILTLL